MEAVEETIDDESIKEVREVLTSQNMIDVIILKNSDYIALIKRAKAENDDDILSLETKMAMLDKELQNRDEKLQLIKTNCEN